MSVLTLIVTLIYTPTVWAQPRPFGDAAIQAAVSRQARSTAIPQIRRMKQRQPCTVKRRVLTGAVIGTAVGMVAVNMAAAGNDGTASGTATLSAGVYGAALGAVIGLGTCR
jgi:hypothetical protein